MDINSKINYRSQLVNWANTTEKYLDNSISGKKLIDSGNLKGSLKHEIYGLTGDVKTFVFKFSLYGMFVDMGLFGGANIDQRNETRTLSKILGRKGAKNRNLKNRNKKAYQWYSRTMYGSIDRLSNILLEHYGTEAIQTIKLPELIKV